jgi:predicted metal-dependent hydrolase
LPLKNKTNQLLLSSICCRLGRSSIKKERKEKVREKERKVREKHKKTIQEKKKEENNLLNLQSPTYKTLI